MRTAPANGPATVATTSSLTPPGPIPAGLVPLEDSDAFLAACMGDGVLSRPVEIWQHNETGDLRTEPDGRRVQEARDRYREIILDALRMGQLTALLLPDAALALPASFWQWPEAKMAIATGAWQDQRLAVAADELRRLAIEQAMGEHEAAESEDPAKDHGAADTGSPTREAVPARRGRKPNPKWPKILGMVSAKLAVEGRPNTQAEVERWIVEAAEKHGESFSVSSIRLHATELLAEYDRGMNE